MYMAQKEWFDDWFDTPYYHQLYFQRDQQEAARFIAALIAHLAPAPGSRMLDVACGRGRHSIQLHSMGFEVIGIDISVSSIAYANQFATDKLQFYVHDMRQPCWINYFDYAFNFFTSFGYFRTRREHDAAMRSIGQAIKPGGTLVVDYLNTHYAEDHLQHTQDIALDGYNYHVTKWMDETHFYKKIEVEHDDFTEPHVYTEKVAKFSLGDFTEMMAYHGLQIQEVFGDYNLGPYDIRKTPRMIMLATRIK
jgi:SAM-dependent methyltransferase